MACNKDYVMFMPQIKMILIFSLIFFSILDNIDESRLLVGGILTLLLALLIIMGLLYAILMLIPEILLRHLWINLTWLTFGGPSILTSGNIPDTRNILLFFLDLIIFLTSNSLVNNVKSSNIIFGISSDHSIVTAKISNNIPMRGRGYWKLNCHHLRHDVHFIGLIKSKIN